MGGSLKLASQYPALASRWLWAVGSPIQSITFTWMHFSKGRPHPPKPSPLKENIVKNDQAEVLTLSLP